MICALFYFFRDFVHAVGGGLRDNNLIESFDKKQSRWILHNYKTRKSRNYSAIVSNVETSSVQC